MADGEREVQPDGTFTVQFSRDMDVTTFDQRVLFRYAGLARPGDRGFEAIRFNYDEGRRALHGGQGDRLQPGRRSSSSSSRGSDLEGRPLRGPPGRIFESAVDILRWQARAAF